MNIIILKLLILMAVINKVDLTHRHIIIIHTHTKVFIWRIILDKTDIIICKYELEYIYIKAEYMNSGK